MNIENSKWGTIAKVNNFIFVLFPLQKACGNFSDSKDMSKKDFNDIQKVVKRKII